MGLGGAQVPCAARGCVLAAGCPAGWERGGEELQGVQPPGSVLPLRRETGDAGEQVLVQIPAFAMP